MRLYFVRHGESEANVAREFSNRGFKHPLTPKGVAQVEALASELAPRGVARVYSSPLQRAVQTAEILARAAGVGVEVADALHEWDVGVLEGTSGTEGWALHNQVVEDWFVHRRLESKIPEGESFLEIRARFVPFIDGLMAAAGQAGDIVVVGHAGLYRAMLPVVLGNIDSQAVWQRPFPNAAYVIAETGPDGLRCLEWCGDLMPNVGC